MLPSDHDAASALTSWTSTSFSADRCTSVHIFHGPKVQRSRKQLCPVCIGQGIVEKYVLRIVEQMVDVSVFLVMEEKWMSS